MPILNLRQLSARQLGPLLEEEVRQWSDELHWDFHGSAELIRKFIDSHSLAGCAVIEEDQPAGYAFYVLEEHKGLIGGLFVSSRYPQLPLSRRMLAAMLEELRGIPRLERIEAQLIPFGVTLDPVLVEQGFRLYTRQFMLLPLRDAPPPSTALSAGLRLEPWHDRHFEPCARLIFLAYANHVDGEINDQYRSEAGAMKFLKNIIILPGCGQFQPDCSFVVRPRDDDCLVGVVLTSEVSRGVGHTTQICVMPGYQGHGLGRFLMETSLQALRARRFSELSLTVTAVNATAVRLYEHLGFRTIKSFAAGVWKP